MLTRRTTSKAVDHQPLRVTITDTLAYFSSAEVWRECLTLRLRPL